MAQAIRVHTPGGPEVLLLEEVALAKPGKGEVLIRQSAVGVNFIDVYHRTGLYKLPYPSGIGMEGAGVVEQAGEGTDLKPGDRVAYCGGPVGSYASERIMDEKHLVKIPAGISDEQAAAVMLKGMTAHYLLYQTFRVQKGHVVLVHAAAGGVGLLLSRWAKHLGATVIGAVGSDKKAIIARANGCDHVIVYTREKVSENVREFTQGQGVDVVYDSVGKATFMDSLDCLKKFGLMVSFGNASGVVPAFEPSLLAQKGSLYLARPNLTHYIEDTNIYRQSAADLLRLIGEGVLTAAIGAHYKLADAAQAHRDLESRKTTGSLLLIP